MPDRAWRQVRVAAPYYPVQCHQPLRMPTTIPLTRRVRKSLKSLTVGFELKRMNDSEWILCQQQCSE